MNNIGIFIDVSSIYYHIGRKYPNRKLDYNKLLDFLKNDGNIYRSFAYGSQIKDESVRFIDRLQHIGFETKYRSTQPSQRVNWNVGIALDIVRIIPKLDIVIIGSNDFELVPLFGWIKDQGVKGIILSSNVCRSLKESADEWIEITEELLECNS